MERKNLMIRNSTAEFLIFQAQSQADGVEVFYHDEMLWLTQKAMATLFNVGIPAISKHLKNIFEEGELAEDSVISKMETTAADGKNYINVYDYEKIHYQHGSQRPLCCGYDRLRKCNE